MIYKLAIERLKGVKAHPQKDIIGGTRRGTAAYGG